MYATKPLNKLGNYTSHSNERRQLMVYHQETFNKGVVYRF